MLAFSVVTNAFYINYRSVSRFGFGWNKDVLPVRAVDFLNKNNISGKMLNYLDYGGYAGFFGNTKTSIDGRLEVMKEKIFSEQTLANDDNSKMNLLERMKPQVILVAHRSTPDWVLFMKKEPGWRLVYADGNSAIYLKNDLAGHIPSVTENNFFIYPEEFSNAELETLLKEKKMPG